VGGRDHCKGPGLEEEKRYAKVRPNRALARKDHQDCGPTAESSLGISPSGVREGGKKNKGTWNETRRSERGGTDRERITHTLRQARASAGHKPGLYLAVASTRGMGQAKIISPQTTRGKKREIKLEPAVKKRVASEFAGERTPRPDAREQPYAGDPSKSRLAARKGAKLGTESRQNGPLNTKRKGATVEGGKVARGTRSPEKRETPINFSRKAACSAVEMHTAPETKSPFKNKRGAGGLTQHDGTFAWSQGRTEKKGRKCSGEKTLTGKSP